MTEERVEYLAKRTDQISPTLIKEGYYYSKAEVARIRGVTLSTIQKWIDKGYLPAIYIAGAYLIRADDLESFEVPNPGPRPRE